MILGGIVGGTYGIDGGGGANPISYYYGKDQTRRVGENYRPMIRANMSPAEFKTTADETYNSGQTDLLTLLNTADATDIDVTGTANNCVFNLPPGRYHLLFQGYSAAGSQAAFRAELRQIQAGTDDIVITHTTGWTTGANPARTTFQLLWHDLIVEGTEQFYLLFPVSGVSARSHFLRIEKVA